MKPWEEMTPRERDALVEEHVLGRCVHQWKTAGDPRNDWWDSWTATCEKCGAERGGHYGMLGPVSGPTKEWSTDIAAAWEMVKKMAADGWNLTLEYKSCGREYPLTAEAYWSRWVSGAPDGDHAVADTAPEAICLAALRAKGVEV